MASVGRLAWTIAATAICVATFAGAAVAQTFPNRPIHVVIGFPAGSAADVLGRYYADELSRLTEQPTIVENEPGEDARVAMRAAAKADPDGYTLLFASDVGIAASQFMVKNAGVSPDAFTPIAACAQIAFALVIPPAAPIKSVQDLVLKLKAKKSNAYGYTSNASLLAGALFKQAATSSAKAVSYAASDDAAKDISEGNLDFMMLNGAFTARDIKRDLVKALAVTGQQRALLLPDTPTMIEAGMPDFVFAPWWGMYAPAKTPQAVMDRLEAWFLQIAASPRTAEFLQAIAASPLYEGSNAARQRLDADIRAWRPLVKAAGLAPE